ncbi:MAG TPA: metallophosphoesterase family protein [Chloroflexota bacterium]|nr:metallophosphoesterase family protein [Chloroflexota bacterium]
MQAVIMSDIHGNLEALRSVAGALPESDVVVVAGDLCLEGPRPAETLDLLRELGWRAVRGNTDQDLVTPPRDLKPAKADMIAWTRRQLGPDRLAWLAALPFSVTVEAAGTPLALVVHANPKNLDQHLYPTMTEEELRPYLDGLESRVLAFGHLHIPYVRPVAGVLLVDVSSVGHPKDGDRRAAYTVLRWDGDQRSVTQVRVPYDIERTIEEMRGSGMPHVEDEIASLLKASY